MVIVLHTFNDRKRKLISMAYRVSCGLLAPFVSIIGTEERYRLGIFNSGAWEKGDRLLVPIGGAAQLTTRGIDYVKLTFMAKEIHQNKEDGHDARFKVENPEIAERAIEFFGTRDCGYFNTDPRSEMIDELTGTELKGILPILSLEEAMKIGIVYDRTVRQLPPKDGAGTSPLGGARRIFHNFTMVMSRELFDKICTSPAIRIINDEEVATTMSGTCKGITVSGIPIADNFTY